MKAIIIDKVHEILLSLLEKSKISCTYLPQMQVADLQNYIQDYDILVVRNKIIDKAIIDKAIKLKYIGRAGAGLDNIEVDYAQSKGIHVFTAAEANADAVAEHTLGMLLSLFHKINFSNEQLKNYVWDREGGRGIELSGKTITIIGFGNMGSAFAKRLQGFGCTCQYYDIKEKDMTNFPYVSKVDLLKMFETSDIISLHIPLTPENTNWVNKSFINNFKKNIYLINVARGEVVETQCIVDGLLNGKISGLCLDVYENEKISTFSVTQKQNFEYLVKHPNVIFTPHVAGWSEESYRKISEVLFQKIITNIKN